MPPPIPFTFIRSSRAMAHSNRSSSNNKKWITGWIGEASVWRQVLDTSCVGNMTSFERLGLSPVQRRILCAVSKTVLFAVWTSHTNVPLDILPIHFGSRPRAIVKKRLLVAQPFIPIASGYQKSEWESRKWQTGGQIFPRFLCFCNFCLILPPYIDYYSRWFGTKTLVTNSADTR